MVVLAYMPVSCLGPRMSFPKTRPANTRPSATRSSSPIASIQYLKELQQELTSKLSEASEGLLDALVDSTFTFSNQPLRPRTHGGKPCLTWNYT
ncbi:hypothetical protein BRADI_3g34721v3 [Brachypodium distachyon]|uniref:Uncharacterized protein n=1 Tax=Brachypodium distachyon TaxID=15368 RepID=A0A0Q3FJ15_BRADI|nr:hypothetical protein BRADI_3g34721v3 [Brachypodium distachyon]